MRTTKYLTNTAIRYKGHIIEFVPLLAIAKLFELPQIDGCSSRELDKQITDIITSFKIKK